MTRQHAFDPKHGLGELLRTALVRHAHLSGNNVRIEMQDREIVLSGMVRSYYQKQLAQESLRSLAGSIKIRNDLVVISI